MDQETKLQVRTTLHFLSSGKDKHKLTSVCVPQQVRSGDPRDQLHGPEPSGETPGGCLNQTLLKTRAGNCLCCQDNSLVVGAGDNNVHVLDLEHGVFKVGPSVPRCRDDGSASCDGCVVSTERPKGSHRLRALCVRPGAGGGASVRQ